MASNTHTALRVRYQDLCWQLRYRSWLSADEVAHIERNLRWTRSKLGKTRRFKTSTIAPPSSTEDAVESEPKIRTPYRKGWHDNWMPTRKRYWESNNNNWKQHGKLRKQWMKSL